MARTGRINAPSTSENPLRNWLLALLGAFLLLACTPSPPRVNGDYQAAGELRVATRLDAISYRTEADGRPSGFEHDLLQALGVRLGVPVRFLVYPDAREALDAVIQGDAHLAAASLGRNDRLPLRWSSPLRDVEYVIVVRDDTATMEQEKDLAGHTVGVRRGSLAAQALDDIRHRIPGIKIQHPTNTGDQQLLEMVAKGTLETAATDRLHFALATKFFPNLSLAHKLPIKSTIAWALPPQAGKLAVEIELFLEDSRTNGLLARLGDRYFGHIRRLEQDDVSVFLSRIRERLPTFRRHFQDAQSITGVDWRLLAALAYQESHWDPLATSRTGVRGMMMLTEDTADRMGVNDRLNPQASIIGGARYFSLLREQLPDEIPEPDRSWMTVAAYNLGMGHFNGARQIARSLGKDNRDWLEIKEVLPLMSQPAYAARLKAGPARGGEALITAENVRTYFEILNRFEAPYIPPLEPPRFKTQPPAPGRFKAPQAGSTTISTPTPDGGQGLRFPAPEATTAD